MPILKPQAGNSQNFTRTSSNHRIKFFSIEFKINNLIQSLLQEIFPYLWEAQGLVSVLCALLEWMRKGNLLLSPSGVWKALQRKTFVFSDSSSWNSDEVDPDSEPWALGGGLLPDLQKLIVSSTKLGEIFTVKFAIPLNLRCYRITPLNITNINKVIFIF